MAWRFILQPNGKIARFSDVVDNITDYNMTKEEAIEFAKYHLGTEDAIKKVERAYTDAKRWVKSLETIEVVHGKDEREKIEKMLSKDDELCDEGSVLWKLASENFNQENYDKYVKHIIGCSECQQKLNIDDGHVEFIKKVLEKELVLVEV